MPKLIILLKVKANTIGMIAVDFSKTLNYFKLLINFQNDLQLMTGFEPLALGLKLQS